MQWCWVNFQCRGVLLIWILVGQGPIALAVGAGGVVWTFLSSSIFSPIFLPLSETARYRLKYVSKGQQQIKPSKTNKPNPVVSGIRTPVYGCYHIYSKVSDKKCVSKCRQ